MIEKLKKLNIGDNLTMGFGLSAVHFNVVENDPESHRIKLSHKLFPSRIDWHKYTDII